MDEQVNDGTPDGQVPGMFNNPDLALTDADPPERPVKQQRTVSEAPFQVIPASNRPSILRSVLKVFVKRSNPNYAQPWQTQVQRSAVGSAFVVDAEQRHILTNAHVIAHHITIHVRRPGHPKKWKASLLCEGKSCDLAVLTVEEDEFWGGISAVTFRDVPELQEQVTVTGYPIGGDSLSITQGIVSRVTMSSYTPGGAQLMNVQIDAAINPGNSGGPGFCNLQKGEVVGVAFSRHKNAEATGYIIPWVVVQHFLESYKRDRMFSGLCCMGMLVQRLENPSLRRFHSLGKEQSGAVVKKLSPLSNASAVLHTNDVITHIAGKAIADDCTLTFRHDERISMQHAIRSSHIRDSVKMRVLRSGTPQEVEYQLGHCLYKVPGLHGVDCWPSYFIYGGLVFQPLSQPLLEHFYGRHVASKAPPSLLAEASEFRQTPDESIVVLSQVLAADITFGYHSSFCRLKSVNDIEIQNIYHLADVCDRCTDEFVRFDMDRSEFTVLVRDEVVKASSAILEAHGIAKDRSDDVCSQASLPKQCIGILAGTMASREARQPMPAGAPPPIPVSANTPAGSCADAAAAAGAPCSHLAVHSGINTTLTTTWGWGDYAGTPGAPGTLSGPADGWAPQR